MPRSGVSRSVGIDISGDPGVRLVARLLRRVFAIEVLVCERCGGARRILGAVTDPPAVRRVLVALGLAAKPPPGRPVPAA